MRVFAYLLWLLPQILWAQDSPVSPCLGVVGLGDSSEEYIRVEIVADNSSRARGLMFREELTENSGMLFLFESDAPRQFWMKNTQIPLDILFYDESGKLNRAHEGAVPFDLTPIQGYGVAVLEVRAGFYQSHKDKLQALRFSRMEKKGCPDNQWDLMSSSSLRIN